MVQESLTARCLPYSINRSPTSPPRCRLCAFLDILGSCNSHSGAKLDLSVRVNQRNSRWPNQSHSSCACENRHKPGIGSSLRHSSACELPPTWPAHHMLRIDYEPDICVLNLYICGRTLRRSLAVRSTFQRAATMTADRSEHNMEQPQRWVC